MTALVDASSAILMYKCGLWDYFCNDFSFRSGTEVYKEITHAGRAGEKIFSETFKGRILQPDDEKAGSSLIKYPTLEKLDPGERELILLYYQKAGDFIILDDRRGVAFCRNEGIPHINALLVPSILYFKEKISETEKNKFTVSLIETGRYSSFVKGFAEKCTREEINYFLG